MRDKRAIPCCIKVGGVVFQRGAPLSAVLACIERHFDFADSPAAHVPAAEKVALRQAFTRSLKAAM